MLINCNSSWGYYFTEFLLILTCFKNYKFLRNYSTYFEIRTNEKLDLSICQPKCSYCFGSPDRCISCGGTVLEAYNYLIPLDDLINESVQFQKCCSMPCLVCVKGYDNKCISC